MPGRDKNVENNLILYEQDPYRPSSMEILCKKYKQQREQNIEVRKQIRQLEHFTVPVAGETVRGVEDKLKEAQVADGGRDRFIEFAKQAKELYAKNLAEHTFWEAAQEIHAALLSLVWTQFHNHIMPHLAAELSQAQLNALVQKFIIAPIKAELGENVLRLYDGEIHGMLYFLTGNCHIKWTK